MAEATVESQKQEVKVDSPEFSIPVEISGKQFLFEGKLPDKPEEFYWYVRVPNWEPIADHVNSRIGRDGESVSLGSAYNFFKNGKGCVGRLDFRETIPADKAPSLHVGYIEVMNWQFAPESGYKDVRGIGSFLVKNMTTFADIKGWRIYLDPQSSDGGGRLSNPELMQWYKRYGFESRYRIPNDKELHGKAFGGMVRTPKTPDLTQPIVQVLTA